MKSTATPKPVNQTYPCLMRENQTGDIVLFSTPNTGMVVCQGNLGRRSDQVGIIGNDWKAEESLIFSPFTGTVTLSND